MKEQYFWFDLHKASESDDKKINYDLMQGTGAATTYETDEYGAIISQNNPIVHPFWKGRYAMMLYSYFLMY